MSNLNRDLLYLKVFELFVELRGVKHSHHNYFSQLCWTKMPDPSNLPSPYNFVEAWWTLRRINILKKSQILQNLTFSSNKFTYLTYLNNLWVEIENK